MPLLRAFRRRRGLTLVELLMVSAILAVLLGLFLPAVLKARVAAGRTQSANNLKQMALATHSCNDTYGRIPAVVGSFPQSANGIAWGGQKPAHFGTTFYFLLPFMEQENVFKATTGNSYTSNAIIKTFQAPGDPTMPANGQTWGHRGAISYAANWHVYRGGWDEDWQTGGVSSIPRSIPDGTSNTILIAERYAVCGDSSKPTGTGYVEHIWGEDGQNAGPTAFRYNTNVWFCPGFWCPTTATPPHPEKFTANYPWKMMPLPQLVPEPKLCNPTRVQAFSVAGIMVGLCDGSTRLVSKGVSQKTWGCAVDPADGLRLGDDW